MPTVLLLILAFLLLYFIYKQKVGYFICFALLFFRIATSLFYTTSTSLYALNPIFLGVCYGVAFICQFNYFNAKTIVQYFKSPVVITMIIVSLLMIVYNAIGPYYDAHKNFILENQMSYLINVFIPFVLLPFFVPDSCTRKEIVDSSTLWGVFYMIVAFVCFDFTSVIIENRELLKDISDGLIGSIMLSKYMAIVAIIAVIKLITTNSSERGRQILYLALATLFGLLMLIAGQRGTLIGVGLALAALLLRDEWRRHTFAISAFAFFGILVALAFFDFSQFEIFQRFSQFQNIKTFNRYYDYFNVWDIFKENGYFWGLGTKGYFLKIGRIYPHNIILEHISDYGLIGLLCILILIFFCIRYSIRLIRYSENYTDIAIASSWIVLCFSAMVSDSILDHRLFYIFSGLLVLTYQDYFSHFFESQEIEHIESE